ncbi:hypothetical protein [Eubacterium callanderi]|uniref:hypothetical protein n=1 Tax=Eubacterium callanderi TaxID=53442 RepID=UPI0008DF1415|nr:hypothetical protein [Eubacterium callanderi]SFO63438.1 hypothetical protein SAMN04487888_103410 [Eubacterium callanderi]
METDLTTYFERLLFIGKILDIFTEKTKAFNYLVDGPPVQKKESVLKGILEERGYTVTAPTHEKYEDVQIANIQFFLMYSINHLNNSYTEAINTDFLDLQDAVIYDFKNRLKEGGG